MTSQGIYYLIRALVALVAIPFHEFPAGLLTTIAVTVSFQLTVLIQAHPHPKAGERCAF